MAVDATVTALRGAALFRTSSPESNGLFMQVGEDSSPTPVLLSAIPLPTELLERDLAVCWGLSTEWASNQHTIKHAIKQDQHKQR